MTQDDEGEELIKSQSNMNQVVADWRKRTLLWSGMNSPLSCNTNAAIMGTAWTISAALIATKPIVDFVYVCVCVCVEKKLPSFRKNKRNRIFQ